MTRRVLARFGAALLVAAAAPSLVSCSDARPTADEPLALTASDAGTTSASDEASAVTSATPTTPTAALATPAIPAGGAAAAAAGAAAAGSNPQQSAGLAASDAAALEAQLSAIEEELDRLTLPSDDDFKDLESGLQ